MEPTLPIYVLQSLQRHAKTSAKTSVAQNFIFSLNIPSEFAFLMVLGINSHILGASGDILSVKNYTVWLFRLCISGSFLKLYGFCIKWELSYIILGPKSFFVL